MSRRAGFSSDVVQLISARAEFCCEVMATGCTLQAATIHHRRPRGQGGTCRAETNYASNGLAICVRCHERVESMRHWALDNGFLVPQHADPRAVPVWWRCAIGPSACKRMVLLDDTGHWWPYAVRKPA